MKKLLLALTLAFASAYSLADWVATQGADYLVAKETACPAAIADKVPAEFRPRLHAAVGHYDGKDYAGCWIQNEDKVYVIYEDGDQGVIPVAAFHKLKEA